MEELDKSVVEKFLLMSEVLQFMKDLGNANKEMERLSTVSASLIIKAQEYINCYGDSLLVPFPPS